MAYSQPFILDLGTNSIRVGHAGDALPKFTTYPVLGLPLTNTLQPCTNVTINSSTKKLSLEHSFFPLMPQVKKDRMDPLFAFYYESNIDTGKYNADFQALERLIEDIASSNGIDETLSESNILLVEPNITEESFREELLNMFSETLQVNSIYFGRRAPLSCYASALITGTVVDIGASCTSIAPVIEGYVNPQHVSQSPVAGDLIDRSINALLNRSNLRVRPPFAVSEQNNNIELLPLPFVTPNYYHWSVMCETARLKHQLLLPDGNKFEPETTDIIRHMVDYILLGKTVNDKDISFDKISNNLLPQPKTYKVPNNTNDMDSQMATMSSKEDVYFESTETLSSYLGNHSLINLLRNSLHSSQIPSNSIVLSGGSTIYTGFETHFNKLLSEIGDFRCIAVGGDEQQYSSFIGASILSSLGGYPPLCLTRAEISEHGIHRALAKKCP